MSSVKILATRAPAKINLTLHIEGRRDDGYHELQSLVAFAGAADLLTLAPGDHFSLVVDGPTAQAAGEAGDNLVARAERALFEEKPGLRSGAFHLAKRLPVAAGVGGGSSDAAAALRLLAEAGGLAPDDPALYAAARKTGADVPVCLAPQAKMMSGIGERLGPPLKLPPLFAVLVNPRQPVETRAVFAKLGLKPGETTSYGPHPLIADGMDFESFLRALNKGRNDMEDAASVLAPVIGHVLAVLSGARGCRLARMSGSGATCFALFETCRQAGAAARAIARGHPEWWVKATVLR
ncbi:4-(cytidine 5'-diphospho)-2-C-methyl-D-erythritol kinase [uncultured Rhodoblastus sp.]|uniref:4-(cytidine 5'-diphospho)-2-C-methyl-D-erythritol kinase n=1 Tax=uncultured Rhodoblastus sp. TaxID=543037 RepID=UPI0025CEA16E|nr:4-(cytidine 5'-diphospho)-2-C-methyl-D-erythritol kinase [uncultured Rhodoblastus sp.]